MEYQDEDGSSDLGPFKKKGKGQDNYKVKLYTCAPTHTHKHSYKHIHCWDDKNSMLSPNCGCYYKHTHAHTLSL